ncbi:MAG: DNA alkylation repair protein [Pirellulales bacterium]|nr:DNA alkylation repair protein [Pirellulales bacterium]
MKAEEILDELKKLGSENIKKVLRNHGVQEPFFGVKIGDLKKIQQRIKKDYELALELYDTGIHDAMYLAGLIADDAKMTKRDLRKWANNAKGGGIESATVPWVAAGSRHGFELALEWIESEKESVAVAGWTTLSCLASVKDDADLNLTELKRLLERVRKTIHRQPNFVRYAMNNFVIALGTYVSALADLAERAAMQIGRVSVDMGNTACQVPYAPEYIKKSRRGGAVAKKRKTVKC